MHPDPTFMRKLAQIVYEERLRQAEQDRRWQPVPAAPGRRAQYFATARCLAQQLIVMIKGWMIFNRW